MFNRSRKIPTLDPTPSNDQEGKKMKISTRLGALVVLGGLGFGTLLGAAPAFADTTPAPTAQNCTQQSNTTNTITCTSNETSVTDIPTISEVNATSVAHKGKTEVTTEVKKFALPKISTSHGCQKVGHNPPKAWKKGHPLCIIVAAGTKVTNSWVDRNGHIIRFHDHVRADTKTQKWQYFFWNKKLDVWQDFVCHNEEWFYGNYATVPASSLVLVNAFSKLDYTLNAHTVVMVSGSTIVSCITTAGNFAEGSGSYYISVVVDVKIHVSAATFLSAKSYVLGSSYRKALNLAITSKASQSTTIKIAGKISLSVHCEYSSSTTGTPVTTPTCSEYGPGYTGDYPQCYKDGNSTPAPPTSAPGPNPPPDPIQNPGSNECYDPQGNPVPPLADGTCPPGSTSSAARGTRNALV